MPRASIIALLSSVLLLGATSGQALVEARPVGPPRPELSAGAVWISEHRVETEIDAGVARTVQTFVLRSTFAQDAEATFLVPLPEDAAIASFAMEMGGKLVQGEVLDKDKAAAIYTSIVQQTRDPALLEFLGSRVCRARVFPIPARGQATVVLRHDEVLRREGRHFELRQAFRASRAQNRPLERASLTYKLRSKEPVMTIWSPSHPVEVVKRGDHEAEIRYEAKDAPADRDFVLMYGLARGGAVDASVLAHAEGDDQGTFLLLLSPSAEPRAKRIAKDVVFVVDTSGSMAGVKLAQTQRALKHCIAALAPEDRFNVIRFSTEAEPLAATLLPSGEAERQRALEFVERLEARGGTNIHEALLTALRQSRSADRPLMIFFCTDGMPTVGVTGQAEILAAVRAANEALVRLFVFGVGDDLNVELLDALSEDHQGARDYVAETEDIEIKVSSLFAKVSDPVLSKVELVIEGLQTSEVHPKRMPDLFRGEQLLVTGRYAGKGPVVVRLRGQIDGKVQEYVFEPEFRPERERTAYVPRLWAVRRVGWLLDEIRLRGTSKELEEEVTRLGKRYGIVTPYTSWLVVEDQPVVERQRGLPGRGGRPGGPTTLGGGGAADKGQAGPTGGIRGAPIPPSAKAGDARDQLAPSDGPGVRAPEAEVEAARRLRFVDRLQREPEPGALAGTRGAPATAKPEEQGGFVGGQVALSLEIKALREARASDGADAKGVVQRIGTRTFLRRGSLWVELPVLELDERELESKLKRITAFTPEWTALIAEGAGWPEVLALGTHLLVLRGGVPILIEPAQSAPAPAPPAGSPPDPSGRKGQ